MNFLIFSIPRGQKPFCRIGGYFVTFLQRGVGYRIFPEKESGGFFREMKGWHKVESGEIVQCTQKIGCFCTQRDLVFLQVMQYPKGEQGAIC